MSTITHIFSKILMNQFDSVDVIIYENVLIIPAEDVDIDSVWLCVFNIPSAVFCRVKFRNLTTSYLYLSQIKFLSSK